MWKLSVLVVFFWSVEALRYGTPVPINQHPYAGLVITDKKNILGSAVVIGSRWIITSQKVHQKRDENGLGPREIILGTLMSNLTIDPGKAFKIEVIYEHPNYNNFYPNVNALVIYQTKNIVHVDNINQIQLGIGLKLGERVPVQVCGWGTDGISRNFSKTVQCGSFVTLSKADCRDRLETFGRSSLYDPHLLCMTGFSESEMICGGDEGGPVISGGLLVGISTTDSDQCATDRHLPSMAIRIEPFIPWIESIITA